MVYLLIFVGGVGFAVGYALLALGRWARVPGVLLAGLGLALGVSLFAARVDFVRTHGGMDCVECNGSPLAFLIGWVTEQLVFTVPCAVVLVLLYADWRAGRRQGGSTPRDRNAVSGRGDR